MSSDVPPTADAAAPGGEGTGTPRFASRSPSAYTILFALIVVTALATWIIPAGRYALDPEGSPIPGTYQEVESNPPRIVVDSLKAPINGLYGIEDPATGNIDVFNSGDAVRRHRRRPVHPRHRRLHRRHDEDRRDPGRASPCSCRGSGVTSAG